MVLGRRAASGARWVALAALVATSGASGAARADAATAEALFQVAKEAIARGDYAAACPKLEASYELDAKLGTLLNVADCHEKAGRLSTSWAAWGEAEMRATRDGDERVAFARSRRAALEARLPRLVIAATGAAGDVRITRDGEPVLPAMLGVPLPVDPGPHAVVVLRADEVLKRESVVAVEQVTVTIAIDLGAFARAAAPPPAPPIAAPRAPSPPAQAAPPASPSQRTVGLVVGGVGAVAVVTAFALEGVALSKKSDTDATGTCVEGYCTPDGLASMQSAGTFADVGQWVLVGGLAALSVGATLVLTAPSARAPASSARWVVPWATPTGGGVALGGAL